MRKISIYVSPFVQRIFEARYGHTEPVRIHRTDVMYTYLQGDFKRMNQDRYRHLRKLLPNTIDLEVSDTIYKHLASANRRYTIGAFLDKIFQYECLNFAYAQKLAGVPAQTAIKTYMRINGVGEDDFSLDSMYTAWLRSKRFFANNYEGKTKHFNLQSAIRERPLPFADQRMPIDYRDIVSCTQAHFQIGICNLLRKSLRISAKGRTFTYIYDPLYDLQYIYEQKILAYLLKHDGQMKSPAIAKLINISHPSIRRWALDIENYVDIYEDVRRDIDAIRRLLPS